MTSTSKATEHGSQIPSRFDANHWRGQVSRYSGDRYVHTPAGMAWEYPESPEPGESCSYSDFTPDTDGRYFLSDFLSGSDYSGSIVERANYKDFLEDFGERDSVHEVYGGHGTFAIAVRIDTIDEEMAAVFDSLEDYPLISEETHSELELEAEGEAWESWAESDFVRELESRFSESGFGELVHVPDSEPEGQSRLFETGERRNPENLEDAVRELFENARETANEYWVNESGGEMYIALDRIADAVDADLLAAHCLKVED